MASPGTGPEFTKGLFDFSTHTVAGDDASVKAFSLTINNPATRVGYQGSAGEADGYSRGAGMEITGNITIKADDAAMEHLDLWQAGTAIGIELDDGAQWDISLPKCVMSGHAMDMANEGVFVDIPFTVTSGAAGAAVPVTIKCT